MNPLYTACEHGRTARHLVIEEHRGNTYYSYCHGLTEFETRPIQWCVNHRNEAWEDDRTLMRCISGAWIEGANAWDCHIVPARLVIDALPGSAGL